MQQQGGSRYGVPPPEMAAPFSPSPQAGQQQPRATRIPAGVEYLQQHQTVAEAASPISSRPPPPQPPVSIFEEYGVGGGTSGGSFPDEEALGAGEESERAGGAGNRWPRQETLALLKIRSDMDAAFRDASHKGPLWEDVSRKLAELGYSRSAKKCKEKFENVHKYYKRTKEGRAGRQDGKSYRFFSQLEALQSYNGGGPVISPVSSLPTATLTSPQPNVSSTTASPGSAMKTAAGLRIEPLAFPSLKPFPMDATAPSRSALELAPNTATVTGVSFSSNTSSSSESDTDGDDTEEGVAGAATMQDTGRKRKREGWPLGSPKMMAFFDGLMKKVMERQEAMQQRFFETLEKREQDRMIREEAWKRQEMARLNREYELMAQERAMAANRDAAVISFLEKFTGSQANQITAPDATISAATPPQPSPAVAQPSSPQHQPKPPVPAAPPEELQPHPPAIEFDDNNNERNQLTVSSEPASTAAVMADMAEAMSGGGIDTVSPSLSSSRWPKSEVIALIKLRSGLETRYLEAGPKGPLWEEISLGMRVLGYCRNAKRCKEKWENINKYFKKVKESNKKRPEDAKTCPYFHELDALYRKKQLSGGGASTPTAGVTIEQQQELAIVKPFPSQIRESLRTLEPTTEQDNSNGRNKQTAMKTNIADGGTHELDSDQTQRNNSTGIPQVFFGGASNRVGPAPMKKPEDIIRKLMEQQNHSRPVLNDYDKLIDLADSDAINQEYEDDEEDYEDDDEEEDGKLQYEIQFQRQGVGPSAGGARAGNATGKVPTAASSAGSFLAMVQ